MPGVRLNFSTHGVSATVGARGASINVGPRGTYANLGLPGTGISSRTRLDSASLPVLPRGTSRETRAAYRAMREQLKHLEEQAAMLSAQTAHEQAEARITALETILRGRNRSPIALDWEGRWAPLPPYVQQPFVPPAKPFSDASIRQEVVAREPVVYLVTICLSGIGALFVSMWSVGFRILCGLASVAAAGAVVVVLRRRSALVRTTTQTRQAEWEAHLTELLAAHTLGEKQRMEAAAHEAEFRARARTAIERNDPEPLAEIIERELSVDALPVPLAVDVECDGIDHVTLEFSLPDFAEIPEARTSLTARGKLSQRAMPQRDRVTLYKTACTGIALRIAADALRALPMLREVRVHGTAERANPATGHPEEIIALRVACEPYRFAALDLDHVDPVAAFEGLGGIFACSRTGELEPLLDETS
jgi:hypothetical protein